MPRTLSTAFRNALEASNNPDAPIIFATITHPELPSPIYVANDIVQYVWGGKTYVAAPFMIELLSDNDSPPVGKITVQNVDRALGRIVRALTTPPTFQIDMVASSGFGDALAGVRTELSPSPSAEMTERRLRLRNVTGDATHIEAELYSYDLSREPWPAVRSTKDRLPGLYR